MVPYMIITMLSLSILIFNVILLLLITVLSKTEIIKIESKALQIFYCIVIGIFLLIKFISNPVRRFDILSHVHYYYYRTKYSALIYFVLFPAIYGYMSSVMYSLYKFMGETYQRPQLVCQFNNI